MEYNNPLNTSAVNQELFNRLFPQSVSANKLQDAAGSQSAAQSAARTVAPAGVTYERYEIDYLNVKLLEQGIAGENRKATASRLSVEALHLTYERLQVSAGPTAADGAGGDAVAKTLNFSLTRAEFAKLGASFNRAPGAGAVPEFLRKFSADLPGPGGAGESARAEEADGLSEGQRKQLGELELLLRTFTDQSDAEIRATIRGIAGALREVSGQKDGPADAAATQVTATSVQVEIKLYASGKVEVREVQDPLVIDLDGDGIELTDAASGVEFDLTGDGKKERSGTVTGDDAFLAYDRNGNGSIDSGRELFGDQHGAANGFAELAKFDGNRDAKIDAQDAVYGDLQLWTDRNANGRSEEDELRGLAAEGVSAISLDYRTYGITGEKNALPEAAAVEFSDGRRHAAGDVNISYIV